MFEERLISSINELAKKNFDGPRIKKIKKDFKKLKD